MAAALMAETAAKKGPEGRDRALLCLLEHGFLPGFINVQSARALACRDVCETSIYQEPHKVVLHTHASVAVKESKYCVRQMEWGQHIGL